MKNIMTMAAVIVLAVMAASPAMAYRGLRVGYGSGPGNVEDIAEVRGLDLTTGQTRRVNALREAHLKDIQPLQNQMLNMSRELRGLWLATTPDREKISLLQKEAQGLLDELAKKITNYRQEVLQLLTPEQQAKVQAYGMGRGMVRMGSGAGMMGGHGHDREMRQPNMEGDDSTRRLRISR